MPGNDPKPSEELTYSIIGAAMEVHRQLRPGLDELFYEKALVIELESQGHRVENQKRFSVQYKGHFLGELIPDIIVDDAVIVDTKVVTQFNDKHIAQMLGYLNITQLDVGLLINFKNASLEQKRILSTHS